MKKIISFILAFLCLGIINGNGFVSYFKNAQGEFDIKLPTTRDSVVSRNFNKEKTYADFQREHEKEVNNRNLRPNTHFNENTSEGINYATYLKGNLEGVMNKNAYQGYQQNYMKQWENEASQKNYNQKGSFGTKNQNEKTYEDYRREHIQNEANRNQNEKTYEDYRRKHLQNEANRNQNEKTYEDYRREHIQNEANKRMINNEKTYEDYRREHIQNEANRNQNEKTYEDYRRKHIQNEANKNIINNAKYHVKVLKHEVNPNYINNGKTYEQFMREHLHNVANKNMINNEKINGDNRREHLHNVANKNNMSNEKSYEDYRTEHLQNEANRNSIRNDRT